jgi:branched-chain amino acid transport system permease protein
VKPAASQIALFGTLLVLLGINALTPRLDPYFLEVCMKVGISIILAVSLNLVNGYTGQFSLGHAGFMAVGAYTSAAITLFAGPKILPSLKFLGETGSASALFLAAIIAAGIMASITGLLVGAPSLRLKGDYLAIVTLGFGEIIRVVFRNIPSLGGAIGLNGIPQYTNFFWTFASAAICIYVVLTMVHSTYGRGFIAVHDDEVASEAMGINTTRYKITAFVVGAFFAGIAGALYSHQITAINPKGFNFILSIEIVVMVILGGMGNTGGVILAAILLTLLPEFLRAINQYRMIIYSFLLIVLMLTRPQGLFNFRNPWKRRAA